MSATFTASMYPLRLSRSLSDESRSKSLITANGGAKAPMKFFFAEGVDPVFHADTGVSLAERGRWNPHMPHAAMSGGRSQAGHVQQRAATDCDDVTVPVDVVHLNF